MKTIFAVAVENASLWEYLSFHETRADARRHAKGQARVLPTTLWGPGENDPVVLPSVEQPPSNDLPKRGCHR